MHWRSQIPQRAVQKFQPQLLEAELPVQDIPTWIAAYCSNPSAPVSLRIRRPDGRLWFEHLTQQRRLADASDSELSSLRYVCSDKGQGRWALIAWQQQLGQAQVTLLCQHACCPAWLSVPLTPTARPPHV